MIIPESPAAPRRHRRSQTDMDKHGRLNESGCLEAEELDGEAAEEDGSAGDCVGETLELIEPYDVNTLNSEQDNYHHSGNCYSTEDGCDEEHSGQTVFSSRIHQHWNQRLAGAEDKNCE